MYEMFSRTKLSSFFELRNISQIIFVALTVFKHDLFKLHELHELHEFGVRLGVGSYRAIINNALADEIHAYFFKHFYGGQVFYMSPAGDEFEIKFIKTCGKLSTFDWSYAILALLASAVVFLSAFLSKNISEHNNTDDSPGGAIKIIGYTG